MFFRRMATRAQRAATDAQRRVALSTIKRDMNRAFRFGAGFEQFVTTNAFYDSLCPTAYGVDASRAAPPGRTRCPYCGIKRADDGKSCAGCGGHL